MDTQAEGKEVEGVELSACGEASLVLTVEVKPEAEEAEIPSVVEEEEVALPPTPPKTLGVLWVWPRLFALAQLVAQPRMMVKLVAQLQPSVQVVEVVVEQERRRVWVSGIC